MRREKGEKEEKPTISPFSRDGDARKISNRFEENCEFFFSARETIVLLRGFRPRIVPSKFGRNDFYDAESWDFQRSESFLRSISLTKAKLESVSRSKQSQLHRALKDRVCHSRSGYQWGCLFCIAKDCSFYCSPLPIILLSTREQKEINIRSSKGTRIPIHF